MNAKFIYAGNTLSSAYPISKFYNVNFCYNDHYQDWYTYSINHFFRESYSEDFSFDCDGMSNIPKNLPYDTQQEWYTICGKKHSDYQSFVRIIATLASIAIPTYSYAYIL